MKIAVTSSGPDLDAQVDPRFGRAANFIIIETDTGEFEVVDNIQNINAPKGAGIQAAQHMSNLAVEAVITGNVGPNAFRTISAAGIKLYLCRDMTVQQAFESFKAGELEEVDKANVEGHWI